MIASVLAAGGWLCAGITHKPNPAHKARHGKKLFFLSFVVGGVGMIFTSIDR
jgi:hypothetical protein